MDGELTRLWRNKQPVFTYTPVGRITEQVRYQLGRFRTEALAGVRQVWAELVGPGLAEVSYPYQLRNNTLIVQVTTPAATFEIEQVKSAVLKNQISDIIGKRVEHIKCVVGNT